MLNPCVTKVVAPPLSLLLLKVFIFLLDRYELELLEVPPLDSLGGTLLDNRVPPYSIIKIDIELRLRRSIYKIFITNILIIVWIIYLSSSGNMI